MQKLALSELLDAPVVDATGAIGGRVREVALCPQDDAARVAAIIVRTKNGERMLASETITSIAAIEVRVSSRLQDWSPLVSTEGFLLLERDLLDQQIIDIHGRKVVRVNDVDFFLEHSNGAPRLKISEVEVGSRGAVRRLLKGVVPRAAINALVKRLSPSVIPWDFVDLIETDPARRVKLRIEHERLARLHPADIADILEELAPAEREAVFESLDEEVAAGILEEIDPKMQVSLMESLDTDHAADIIEEMDPDAAADLLADLSEETSEEILEEMEQEEREEVEELLEFSEESAAGRMTTDYLSVVSGSTVADAIAALRGHEGGIESVTNIYLVNGGEKLVGAVPLAQLALLPLGARLEPSTERVISCNLHAHDNDVAELFDKYNLLTLPVIDGDGRLCGVITADDIIGLLRKKL